MTFHDVRLNEDIERGAVGGPEFKTAVVSLLSGHESRNADWQTVRNRYDVSYGVQDKDAYSLIIQHFLARRGRLHSFPFKDWSDFQATAQATSPSTGDGSNATFQLQKTYSDAGGSYVRTVTRPVTSTIRVFVDAVEQTLTTDYTVGALGVITFTGGSIPALGAAVTATFEFDIPARYDTDWLALQVEWFDAASVPEIALLEVRE